MGEWLTVVGGVFVVHYFFMVVIFDVCGWLNEH